MPRPKGVDKIQIAPRLPADDVDKMRWILRNPANARNPYSTSFVNYGSVNALFEVLLRKWLEPVEGKLPNIEQIREDLYGGRNK